MWLHQFYTALAHSHSSHPLPTVHIIVHCTTCDAINFKVQLDSFDRWHVLYRKERLFEPYPNVHDSVKHDRGIRKNVHSWPENSFENLLCWHYQSRTPFQKKFLIFGTFAKRFPLNWSSRRRRMSNKRKKERKKRKRRWEEEKANVSLLRIPRKNASLLPRP